MEILGQFSAEIDSEALLRANQMNASLPDVAPELKTLWSLVLLYGLIAVAATALAPRRIA